MVALFAATMGLSATLMFVVQPLFGKMVLPLLGGVPAVWNTCLVFFQATLLAGYLYAHLLSTRVSGGRQILLHGAVVLLPLAILPIGLADEWQPPDESGQVTWLLGVLAVTVGLPLFVVSTSAPLLQRRFSRTSHAQAPDPYFLYSASNVGSVTGLLAYPLVLEPWLPVSLQSVGWTVGYGVLVCGMAACGIAMWRSTARASPGPGPAVREESRAQPAARRRVEWLVLSAIPASLLYGVTTYISTDVASFPLVWVMPLGLYLLTFIIAFARRPPVSPRWTSAVLPFVAVPAVFSILSGGSAGVITLVLHLGVFFLAALLCHGRLAASRPPSRDLTVFFLWVSIGGVIGGLLNAFVAPAILTSTIEYPAMLALACFYRFDVRDGDLWTRARTRPPEVARAAPRTAWSDWILPMSLGLWLLVLREGVSHLDWPTRLSFAVAPGLPMLASAMLGPWRLRFALGLGSLVFAGWLVGPFGGDVLYAERTFFGVIRVEHDAAANVHRLLHGTTLHGEQSLDPRRRLEPTSYYHRDGPLGQVFETRLGRSPGSRVGVVGLGTGATACHGHADQDWVFFEIDHAIERIAREPRLFSYLEGCRPSARVVLGDGRRLLRREPDGRLSILIVDGFGSDAIPVHLLTREAFVLYRRKLVTGGLLVVHLSSRFLDLEPVVRATAGSLGLGMRTRADQPGDGRADGRLPSTWAVLSDDRQALDSLSGRRDWQPPMAGDRVAVWTDEYAPVLSAAKWWPF